MEEQKKEYLNYENDILEIKEELQRLSNLVTSAKTGQNSGVDLYSILSSLKGQITTMNNMTTTIVTQANDNYARVEKKVDDNNARLDLFQKEMQDFTMAVTQLSMKIETKVAEQDSKIEKIESAFGEMAGEWCGTDTKTFCEELKKNEKSLRKIIDSKINMEGNIKTIKQSFFSNIGASLLAVMLFIMFLLYIGSTVFINYKIDDMKKNNPIIKSIKP